MDLGIRDRVAIVTAASRGLGRASALALAAEGTRLVISARSEHELESLRDEVDVPVEIIPGDMNDPELPSRLVKHAVERFGRLDIVIGNNAGPPPADAFEISDDQLLTAFNANLLSSVRLVRAARQPMLDAGWGRICLIASGSAVQPMDNLALSNTIRPGLWGWAKTASNELAGTGITLNLVCPGLHATERAVQLGRQDRSYIGNADDFGHIIAFLASAHTSFLNGTAVIVDGGRVQRL